MAKRKPFLVRLAPELHDELRRWADDDVRSLNAQIEYLLRQAVKKQRGVSVPSGRATQVGQDED